MNGTSQISAPFRQDGAIKSMVVAAAVLILWLLWRVNCDKLADFYDYSLLSYGIAFLQKGWKPYVDFLTPLQPFTYYLAYGCELVFGQRYLALAYGNLILTLALFGLTLNFARKMLSYYEAVAIAMIACISSTLQHGVIWYNCIGLFWFVAVCSICFDAVKSDDLDRRELPLLTISLVGAGLTKLNFLAASLGVLWFCAAVLFLRDPCRQRIRILLAAALLTAAAVLFPLAGELWTTGASIQQWVYNVIQAPSSRSHNLKYIRTGAFWFGRIHPFYYHDPARGFFAIAGGVYAISAVATRPRKEAADRGQAWWSSAWIASQAGLMMFLGLAALLTVMNVDIELISEFACVVGLLSLLLGFGSRLGRSYRLAVRAAIWSLSLFFLAGGLISIRYNTRLKYGIRDANSAPFSRRISTPGYLEGVYLTDACYRRLQDARALISEFSITQGSNEVYWGPGLEMLDRIFQTQPVPGFPLWYTDGITVHEQESMQLVDRLEASPIRLFVADQFWIGSGGGLPENMRNRLARDWRKGTKGSLVYYFRTPSRVGGRAAGANSTRSQKSIPVSF